MTPDRWQRIKDLFEAAVEREGPDRAGFVATACDGDEEMRRAVERLLAGHDQAGNFLEQPYGGDDIAAVKDLPAAPDEGGDLIGKRIGRYAITRLIGKGGMGAVYR